MKEGELNPNQERRAVERGPAFMGLGWVIWFFGMLVAGSMGALNVEPGGFPVWITVALLAPISLYVMDVTVFQRNLFACFWSMPLEILTRFQVYRVAGAFFLVEWALGRLPWEFAVPAALGDIAIGIAALFIGDGLAGGKKDRRNQAIWWNILGIADLGIAFTLGVIYSHSALGIFAGPVTTESMAVYPLSLIPSLLIPFSIILHVTGLMRLKATRGESLLRSHIESRMRT